LSAVEKKMDDALEKKMGDARQNLDMHVSHYVSLQAQNMHNMWPKCVWAELGCVWAPPVARQTFVWQKCSQRKRSQTDLRLAKM
jgi:hypothetical protein